MKFFNVQTTYFESKHSPFLIKTILFGHNARPNKRQFSGFFHFQFVKNILENQSRLYIPVAFL